MRWLVMLPLLAGCQAVFRLDHLADLDAPTSSDIGGDGTTDAPSCTVFRPRAAYAAMATPASLVVVDIDGNGAADVVLGSVTAHTLQAFENAGGSFTPGPVSNPTIAPASMASGTFSSDNLADLAIVDHTSTVRLMIGNGSFTFVGGNAYTTTAPGALAVGDYDGDGNADVIVTDFANSQMHAWQGNGAGVLSLQTTGSAGLGPVAIVKANLDGDANADFVVADQGASEYATLTGSGAQFSVAALADVAAGVAAADLDGDTNDDPIFTLPGSGEIEAVVAGSTIRLSTTPGFEPTLLVAADFDGDHEPDVVFYDANSMVLVEMRGNGDGTFGNSSATGEHVIAVPASVAAMGVGDFDGDSRPDLAVAMGDITPQLSILLACP